MREYTGRSIFALLFCLSMMAGCSDPKQESSTTVVPPKNPVCNNGVLESGEICDGNYFLQGFAICPTGTTGTAVCTPTCTVDYSRCVATQQEDIGCSTVSPSCQNGIWSYCGASKQIETMNCKEQGLLCDDAVGCVICENDKIKCQDNSLMKCVDHDWKLDTDCTASKRVCSEETKSCLVWCQEKDRRCRGDIFEECVDGQWVSQECKRGSVCSETLGCTPLEYQCVGNTLIMCDADNPDDCIDMDCTKEARICDVDFGDCVAHPFTCNGTTIEIIEDGTKYTYDCADNLKSTGRTERDKVMCSTILGCQSIVCKNNNPTLCVYNDSSQDVECEDNIEICDEGMCADGMGCTGCNFDTVTCEGNVAVSCIEGDIVREDCAAKEWKCDANQGGCYNPVPCTDDDSKCEGNVFYLCIEDTWLSETCGNGMECDVKNGCVPLGSAKCGNNIKEEGEACDGTAVYGTCNEFDPNLIWQQGGKPACSSDCKKITTGTCKEKDSVIIKSFSFKDLNAIVSYIKYKQITIKGGFTTSTYTFDDGKDGWIIGSWGNGTSPALGSRYIAFNIGNVSNYDSAFVTFDVKRTATGPKFLQLGFYSGTTLVSQSSAFEIGTSFTTQKISVPQFSSITGEFSVRLSGYGSYSNKSGTMTISEVAVHGTIK